MLFFAKKREKMKNGKYTKKVKTNKIDYKISLRKRTRIRKKKLN